MGGQSSKSLHYMVHVHTGDKKGAGTDANIYIKLHGEETTSRDIKLTSLLKNNFERGHTDHFPVRQVEDIGCIKRIELWRDSFGLGHSWYVDRVEVEKVSTGELFCFPVHRWIKKAVRYHIPLYDAVLPQNDDRQEQRKLELEHKRKLYEFEMVIADSIPQVKNFPSDEAFSSDFKWALATRILELKLKIKIIEHTDSKWKQLDDIKRIYTKDLYMPKTIEYWNEDENFGQQRLSGSNPCMIRLCTQLPEYFPVTDEMLQPIIEDMTISQAIEGKRLFLVDHTDALHKICTRDPDHIMTAPIALFFVNKNKDLMPVAIQLFKEPAEDNPIFLPTDPPHTWTIAKMWFNVADSNIHESSSHLGFTHIVMESVCIATNRCLSPSHPLFRLLAPHFLFLMAINNKAVKELTSDNGYVDNTIQMGVVGMFEVIRRGWKDWYLNKQGCLPNDLKDRGVDDPDVLPNYYYRDDAILFYQAIEKYVRAVVDGYYKTPEDLTNDYELQEWGRVLATPHEGVHGGCGIRGVPGDGKFETKEQLIEILSSLIFTGSVQHAATNFIQYDEAAFQPNYPQFMIGTPPKDKSPRTENDILQLVHNKERMLLSMMVLRILSERGTNNIGNFEVQYAYDPIAVKAADEFRAELEKIGETIDERNKTRKREYPYLHPKDVPNAISI